MKELNLAPGEYLFKEGNTDSSLFFLNKGLVEVCILIPQKNDKNKEKVITKYSVRSTENVIIECENYSNLELQLIFFFLCFLFLQGGSLIGH